MTKQYLLIAVASFLLLLSVACSSNSEEVSPIEPTPDIEATISARIKSIDIPATVEAMVEKRLLNAPTPFPKIIERVVEVEVIKEVPVPATTVSITPTPQIIEKIVEIEVIKEIPAPVTPIPFTPTPTLVPSSEFIQLTTTRDGFDVYGLVTNLHPSLSIGGLYISYDVTYKDENGKSIWSGEKALTQDITTTVFPCISPGETATMRFNLNSPDIGVLRDYKLKNLYSYYCPGLKGIEQSLISDYSIELAREAASEFTDESRPLGFNVVVSNNSPISIGWTGEMIVRDVDGNVIHKSLHNTKFVKGGGCLGPQEKWVFAAKPSVDMFLRSISNYYSGTEFTQAEFKTVELYECK